MKNQLFIILIFILIFVIVTILKLFGVLESYQQFVAVLLSACATYVIVTITMTNQSRQQKDLMNQQSENEENKDKNIRIYEKKLAVYSRFNALLWKSSDAKSFKKVADMCMQELIFSISNDKIEELSQLLAQARKDCETLDKAKDSYAAITSLLKRDLQNDNSNDLEKIEKVFDAVYNPEEDTIQEPTTILHTEQDGDSTTDTIWKNKTIAKAWEDYENGKIFCWHFNAWEVEKQKQVLDSDNKILSLIEYDEDWRTERLKQVHSGDIVFLFNRGGAGYVGMYRALGTIVLRNEEKGIYMSESGAEEKQVSSEEAKKFDIYSAIQDGATFVSSIRVEPILLRNHSQNPIGTMRQTIVRPNGDNVWELMKYFDSEDKS